MDTIPFLLTIFWNFPPKRTAQCFSPICWNRAADRRAFHNLKLYCTVYPQSNSVVGRTQNRMFVAVKVTLLFIVTQSLVQITQGDCDSNSKALKFINDKGQDWFSSKTAMFNLFDCFQIVQRKSLYCSTLAKDRLQKDDLCGPCPYRVEEVQLPPSFLPNFLITVSCNVEGEERKPWFWLCTSLIKTVEVSVTKSSKKFSLNVSQGCVCQPPETNKTVRPHVVI